MFLNRQFAYLKMCSRTKAAKISHKWVKHAVRWRPTHSRSKGRLPPPLAPCLHVFLCLIVGVIRLIISIAAARRRPQQRGVFAKGRHSWLIDIQFTNLGQTLALLCILVFINQQFLNRAHISTECQGCRNSNNYPFSSPLVPFITPKICEGRRMLSFCYFLSPAVTIHSW